MILATDNEWTKWSHSARDASLCGNSATARVNEQEEEGVSRARACMLPTFMTTY